MIGRACCGYADMAATIVRSHFGCFAGPVLGVSLLNAQRIYLGIPDAKSTTEDNRVGVRFGHYSPWNRLLQGREVIPCRSKRLDLSPAMAEAGVHFRFTVSDSDPNNISFRSSQIKYASWERLFLSIRAFRGKFLACIDPRARQLQGLRCTRVAIDLPRFWYLSKIRGLVWQVYTLVVGSLPHSGRTLLTQ